MAWINVYEDVDGPKLRSLAKLADCSRLEALGALIAVWLWGIKNADATGLIKSADRRDVADVISTKLSDGVSAKAVVNAMVESGWIDEREGSLFFHDWDTWQEMWYKYLNRRERDAERKRANRMTEKGGADKEQDPAPDGPDAGQPDSAEADPDGISGSPEGTRKSKYPVAFEAFWKEYPRQVDKGTAYKKYAARRKDGYSDDELIEAARRYALQCKQRGTEPEFIKHPKTFLSDTMPFTDYLPKQETLPADPDENPFKEYDNE